MDKKFHNYNLELWGGIECTINRIGDEYLDQLKYSNHYLRAGDLEKVASLGIKTLRYPVLWEYHEPIEGGDIDWSFTTRQFETMNSFGIKPIAGLLHHGSGPLFTNLLDDLFPEKLARYAGLVAKRFPWIEAYTPVNEPLTTSRFSGLYGFWYPHKQNDICFSKMLLNQLKGIVCSMKAIREINPAARLVQTEDLGKTYCTPPLLYQANFENERRWLTTDLLCGKVDSSHSMWGYFTRLGISTKTLDFFLDNPCPPDIIGFNHYITSERFLDEDLFKYPSYTHGGNELHKYADVEAVRISSVKRVGLKNLLSEAWHRYQLPLAITEAQLNCTREEQLRWLAEIWNTSNELLSEGVDFRAVTAWSLFGAYGWNSLLTTKKMEYEPGAFDLRTPTPRPTALTSLIRSYTLGTDYDHPILKQKGWWHRDTRFRSSSLKPLTSRLSPNNLRPIVIIGKNGTLGKEFAFNCSTRALDYILLGRDEVNITNPLEVENIIRVYEPWAIINAAGFVKVDDAEIHPERCYSENALGPEILSISCQNHGIKLLSFSSDLVFDGSNFQGYRETDVINPLNVYGKSKAAAEIAILNNNRNGLIIRTSAFFGPRDHFNFVHLVLESLRSNESFCAADDICVSPTYTPDLVNVSLDLLIDGENGIWHLSNAGEITWAQLAMKVALRANLDSDLIIPRPKRLMNYRAERPGYTVLKSNYGSLLPSLENALTRFFEEKGLDIFYNHETALTGIQAN